MQKLPLWELNNFSSFFKNPVCSEDFSPLFNDLNLKRSADNFYFMPLNGPKKVGLGRVRRTGHSALMTAKSLCQI
jgi:hypothetical protein